MKIEDCCCPKECCGNVNIIECDLSVAKGVDDVESDEVDIQGELHDEVVPSDIHGREVKSRDGHEEHEPTVKVGHGSLPHAG